MHGSLGQAGPNVVGVLSTLLKSAQDCSSPPDTDVPNSLAQGQCNLTEGATCELLCDTGYNPTVPTVICTAGSWSPRPSCVGPPPSTSVVCQSPTCTAADYQDGGACCPGIPCNTTGADGDPGLDTAGEPGQCVCKPGYSGNVTYSCDAPGQCNVTSSCIGIQCGPKYTEGTPGACTCTAPFSGTVVYGSDSISGGCGCGIDEYMLVDVEPAKCVHCPVGSSTWGSAGTDLAGCECETGVDPASNRTSLVCSAICIAPYWNAPAFPCGLEICDMEAQCSPTETCMCPDGRRGNPLADLPDSGCAVCGDQVLDAPHEECDDGNLEDGDGCDERCMKEKDVLETDWLPWVIGLVLGGFCCICVCAPVAWCITSTCNRIKADGEDDTDFDDDDEFDAVPRPSSAASQEHGRRPPSTASRPFSSQSMARRRSSSVGDRIPSHMRSRPETPVEAQKRTEELATELTDALQLVREIQDEMVYVRRSGDDGPVELVPEVNDGMLRVFGSLPSCAFSALSSCSSKLTCHHTFPGHSSARKPRCRAQEPISSMNQLLPYILWQLTTCLFYVHGYITRVTPIITEQCKSSTANIWGSAILASCAIPPSGPSPSMPYMSPMSPASSHYPYGMPAPAPYPYSPPPEDQYAGIRRQIPKEGSAAHLGHSTWDAQMMRMNTEAETASYSPSQSTSSNVQEAAPSPDFMSHVAHQPSLHPQSRTSYSRPGSDQVSPLFRPQSRPGSRTNHQTQASQKHTTMADLAADYCKDPDSPTGRPRTPATPNPLANPEFGGRPPVSPPQKDARGPSRQMNGEQMLSPHKPGTSESLRSGSSSGSRKRVT
eukprot:gene6386-1138_t